MPTKYSPEIKAKAVRLVRDHVQDYGSEWEAMKTVSGRLGMTPETLRRWVRQAEIDDGGRAGISTNEQAEIRRLRREVAELKRTNDILKAASTFFARELDPPRI
jgi:transposase